MLVDPKTECATMQLMKMATPLLISAFATISIAAAQDTDSAEETVTQNSQGEPLGWTVPLSADSSDSSSELDRLSKSSSGVGFAASIYDSQADNPLVPVAVTIRALDKITATYKDIDIPIGEEVSFGALSLLPRTCDKRPPEEFPETTVFLEVFTSGTDIQGARTRAARSDDELPQVSTVQLPGEDLSEQTRPALFRGWMFASSPSLNALEHPVYDVWVVDCKMEDPRT